MSCHPSLAHRVTTGITQRILDLVIRVIGNKAYQATVVAKIRTTPIKVLKTLLIESLTLQVGVWGLGPYEA